MEKHVRRRYFVENKFQLKFAGMILFFMFAVAAVSALTIYYYLWMALGEKLANVYPQGRLMGIMTAANILLFKRIVLFAPLIFALAIVLSHRIAGPIYRIKMIINEVIKGDYKRRIHLRRTDELKDLAESINNLIEHLEQKAGR